MDEGGYGWMKESEDDSMLPVRWSDFQGRRAHRSLVKKIGMT